MSKVNTLEWHDVKKELPLAIDESEKRIMIVAVGDEEDMQWSTAVYDNDKGIWYNSYKVTINGTEYNINSEVKDVRYWSKFPICSFKQ